MVYTKTEPQGVNASLFTSYSPNLSKHESKGHGGLLPISTPEATAFDLIRYANRIGGLDTVTTLLIELCEAIDPKRLAHTAKREPHNALIQRLGWLLERVEQPRLADSLRGLLARRPPISRAKLDPSGGWKDCPVNSRWQVVENASPEADL